MSNDLLDVPPIVMWIGIGEMMSSVIWDHDLQRSFKNNITDLDNEIVSEKNYDLIL